MEYNEVLEYVTEVLKERGKGITVDMAEEIIYTFEEVIGEQIREWTEDQFNSAKGLLDLLMTGHLTYGRPTFGNWKYGNFKLDIVLTPENFKRLAPVLLGHDFSASEYLERFMPQTKSEFLSLLMRMTEDE